MSLDVEIGINGDLKSTIHISRIAQETPSSPDSINNYKVVEKPWRGEERGATFTHRYGDGFTACVRRALDALGGSVETTLRDQVRSLEEQVVMLAPEPLKDQWQTLNAMLREYSLACSVTFTETRLDEITDRVLWFFRDEEI